MKPPEHIHILSICGYTTSGLALMAKEMGYLVTGADEDAYPPTTDILSKNKITWRNFYDPKNLLDLGRPDLVVQGNQTSQDNLELAEAKKLGIPVISDSQYFYELTKNRSRIVVTGSHGKTTTSALTVWVLEVAGKSPGFRLGTITKNFGSAVRLGKGRPFVFEGDEYTTTSGDPRPKFFYFRPQIAIINNIEWDHPDVFKTPSVYLNLFRKYLIEAMPREGLLVVNADDANVVKLVKKSSCEVISFGLKRGDYRATNIEYAASVTSFTVFYRDKKLADIRTSLPGEHNVRNCLAALSLCHQTGVSIFTIKKALLSFKGTSRRFETVGVVGGVTVIDDYAHHPTKVSETIKAARSRYPKSRLFVIYVPHTYSRTQAFFKQYADCFKSAQYLIMADIEPARERHLKALVHSRDLVSEIKKKQKGVYYEPSQKGIIDFVKTKVRRGDVILCMSVRGFDDLARKLFEALKGANKYGIK